MFYLYQSRINFDQCMRCNENIDEPKLLPCGNTICTSCETEIKSKKHDHFKCSLCGETHIIDKNKDFPINQTLKKFKKVHWTRNYQQMFENVQNINELFIRINSTVENMESKLKNHCDNLRYQVDLSTESAIESLNIDFEAPNKNREEMLDMISKFENKKISEIKQFLKEECEQSIATLMIAFEKLKNELQKCNEDPRDILIEIAVGLKDKLEETKNTIDEFYKNGLLFFHKSIQNMNSTCVGQLNTIPNGENSDANVELFD
jgi:predicted RNA-binding Zn-ribbon protein involved in translation (DUF1610 family)